jgi:Zn-finger nucleic acid-binding protein
LAAVGGEAPYQVWVDSSPHRYVVRGDVVVVPHDHCPQCWGLWDFKELHPECPACGARMGEEVKLLLDTDCCPNCEEGKVTAGEPRCSECGFAVIPGHVVWG